MKAKIFIFAAWGALAPALASAQTTYDARSGTPEASSFGWEPLNYISIRGIVGPVFALGDGRVREASRLGPVVGGSVIYAYRPNLSANFAYDRLDLARTIQTEQLTGGFTYRPGGDRERYAPFFSANVGLGKSDETDNLDNLAFKFGVGLDRLFTPTISFGAAVYWYHIADDAAPFDYTINAIAPAVTFAYHFGAGAPSRP